MSLVKAGRLVYNGIRYLQGQINLKARSASQITFDTNGPSHGGRQLGHNRQTEARTAMFAIVGQFGLGIGLKQSFQVLGWNTTTRVLDLNLDYNDIVQAA